MKIKFLVIAVLSILLSAQSKSQICWQLVSTISDPYLRIVKYNNNHFFAAASNVTGIGSPSQYSFYSSPDLNTWTPISISLPSQAGLAFNIDNNNNLFLSTQHNGIYESSNLGLTWTFANVGNGYGCMALDFETDSSNNFYAGVSGFLRGLYVSNNNGSSWINKIPGLDVIEIHSVKNLNNVFACNWGNPGNTGNIYNSIDNGNNWTQIMGQPFSSNAVMVKNINDSIFVFSINGNIYLSTNNGSSWTNYSAIPIQGTASIYFNDAVFLPNNIWWVSYSLNGLWRSNDNGITWSRKDSCISGDLHYLFNDGNKVLATTSNGIYKFEECSSNLPVNINASGSTTFCSGGNVTLTATTGATYLWNTGATTQSINVTTSGNYTVAVTNAFGCSGVSAPTAVNVITTPVASITSSDTKICGNGSVLLIANAGVAYQWYRNNIAITGATYQTYPATSGGNYKALVTNVCGPATSNTIQITKYNLPSIILTTSGPTSFCSGSSVTINVTTNASPNATFQWYEGPNPISGETSTSYLANKTSTYRVYITNTVNGCTRSSNGVSVKILDPKASVNASGPLTFCAGDSVVFTAVTNAGVGALYQWFKGANAINGATASSYTAKLNGTYKVRVTNSSGCTKLSGGKKVTVSCRMNENFESEIISVFPNPNSGSFTFEYNGLSEEENGTAVIQLYNSAGQMVYDFKAEVVNGSISIELNLTNTVKNGIYFLKMDFNNQIYKSKVIIN